MKIPEYKIELVPRSDQAERSQGFAWADPEIGTRSKIGGEPDFIQGQEIPSCPGCGNRMSFFSQIDSIGDELSFADVGILYTFVCFGCFEAESVIQSG
ncbi:MAG: hypothetical protein RIE06_29125 [Roseibium album]|uniref:hypothetical protein n=1 Tax=Roseibium album TaxID=311410 RepID=UPI000CF0C630|nr:uncharacterized protein YwqG [Labrenzia sp. EL_142]